MRTHHYLAAAVVAGLVLIGHIPEDNPLYTLLGITLLTLITLGCVGLVHPHRR